MTRTAPVVHFDGPVIVGAGLAGLMTAVELAPLKCLVLSGGPVSTGTSTGWAQGGVAAAVGPDDSPDLHAADTLAAGAGLCEPDAVRRITGAAADAIARMADVGTRFDRTSEGTYLLGLEGAHSRRRIVHAQGDGTGAELLRAAVEAARALPSVTLWDESRGTDLIVRDGRVVGIRVDRPGGTTIVATDRVVLATGGVGGLFADTTNPLTSRGSGLALAARAGAVLRDVEMVQFHPTALDVGIDPMPLVSEAVRGEGALLVDETGARVIENPLAARDVVSRAEWAALRGGRRVFLDAREDPGPRFRERFPSISEILDAAGLDPVRDLLPVRPAAHYHMGGVLVDEAGRTTVRGLSAVGEVASTGLHGANRLASNSLLEAIVCAGEVAADLRRGTPVRTSVDLAENRTSVEPVQTPTPTPSAPVAVPAPRRQLTATELADVRRIASTHLGVARDANGLRAALTLLRPWRDTDEGLVATMIAWCALQRQESRGAHARTDFAGLDPAAAHTLVDLAEILGAEAA